VWKFLQEERAGVLLLEDAVVEEGIANSEAVEIVSPEVVDPEVLVEIVNLEVAVTASPQHQMILQKNEDRI
jgi:hypothetical protein